MLKTDLLGENLHIWLCKVDDLRDPALLDRFASWLDEAEIRRHKRYRFDKDRHLFLVAHALLRHSLSRYSGRAPGDWRFTLGPYGRPEISGADRDLELELRFNLSHARGLAAVIVNRKIDCGVDVEPRDRDVDYIKLSKRVFAAKERADLLAQNPGGQGRRFFEYWTLKESYIKARGMGLALPLDRFSFTVADPISITFGPPIEDDPDAWQFELHQPTDEHQLALAAKRGPAPNRKTFLHWTDLAEEPGPGPES